ncbi:MAG TPA: translation initiation factor IF-2 [Pseudomonadota bacterium]|nr:translation initiation factor IF-2 [Pseudomonadota bacterium]
MNTESVGTAGSKVAIYELAKELGIAHKDLVEKVRALGIEAKNHMSRLERDEVDRVRRAFDKERHDNTVQERVSETVIRRRAKDGSRLHPEAQHAVANPPPPPVVETRPPPVVVQSEPPRRIVRVVSPAPETPVRPVADVKPTPPPVVTPPSPPAQVVSEKPAAVKVEPVAVKAKPVDPTPAPVVATTPAAAPVAAPTVESTAKAGDPAKKPARAKAASEPLAPAKADVVAEKPVATETPAPVKVEAAPAAPTPVVAKPPVVEAKPAPVESKPVAAKAVEAPPVAKVEAPAAPAAKVEAAKPAPVESKPAAAKPVVQVAPKPAVAEAAKSVATPAAQAKSQGVVSRPAPAAPVVETAAKSAAPRHVEPAVAPPPAEPVRAASASAPSATSPSQGAPAKVFVTAQTRRSLEGLGPTGRVIDLSAFKPQPSAKPAAPSSESPRNFRSGGERTDTPEMGRGPRQEVSGERLRGGQESRRAPVGPVQPARGKLPPGRKPGKTQITTAAEHKRVVKMGETIVIAELARQMAQKATDVLKKIWELGMRNVMINSSIDFDTAQLVASEFEWRVESTAFQEQSVVVETTDKPEDLKPRAPVITIMGHVDHGKTSLLDAIRNANVAAGEAGGITQHIGAYKVTSQAGDVVFLDTPGHEAFTEMRARGAQVTDIVVLVVAADDGIMPQTVEALNHAKDAKVPVIVAVNKIDKQGAQPDRIRQQLAAHGLTSEEWGGETIFCDVSARTKIGVDRLLEMLALQSEVLELRANPNKAAKGAVIEARMDAKRGPVATVLVQEGTLRVGDTVVVGEEMGKVRAMSDDKGRTLAQAGPSTPVELLGLSGVPRAGEVLNAVADERASKELVEHRRLRRIERDRAKAGPVSLDKLMDAMKAGLKELKIILKADVQGSSEALGSALGKLSTKEVKVSIIQSGVGGITESDVNLAKAGNAIIIGFHVRPAGKAAALAEQEGVDIKLYDIIYDALDDVKLAMAGLLAPVKRDKFLGKAEVREIFNIPKVGIVAGCSVVEGTMKRSAMARLIRDSVLIYSGKLGSLRRFKDDVREVQQGYECGMSIDGYLDIKVGDVIESYEVEEIAPTLA